jgi:hypothetical protein
MQERPSGVHQLDGFGHGISIFTAMLHGFEAQVGSVHADPSADFLVRAAQTDA